MTSEASFVGIEFAVGTSLRIANTMSIVDGGIALPDARSRSFWLDGRRWETPLVDDAELFVAQLLQHGVIVRDPVVTAVVRGDRSELSARTVERRFRAATGLTRGTVMQIERVRTAAAMLATGERMGDIVDRLDYFDEPTLHGCCAATSGDQLDRCAWARAAQSDSILVSARGRRRVC